MQVANFEQNTITFFHIRSGNQGACQNIFMHLTVELYVYTCIWDAHITMRGGKQEHNFQQLPPNIHYHTIAATEICRVLSFGISIANVLLTKKKGGGAVFCSKHIGTVQSWNSLKQTMENWPEYSILFSFSIKSRNPYTLRNVKMIQYNKQLCHNSN